jgi:hypothetical protein
MQCSEIQPVRLPHDKFSLLKAIHRNIVFPPHRRSRPLIVDDNVGFVLWLRDIFTVGMEYCAWIGLPRP